MQKIIGRQLVITVFEQNKHGTFFYIENVKKIVAMLILRVILITQS